MIEYVRPEDVDALKEARTHREVGDIVGEIVERIPAPRIFVASPTTHPDVLVRYRRERAFFRAVEGLMARHRGVIDPLLVAQLLTFNRSWDPVPRDEHSLFQRLLAKGLIGELWVPAHWKVNERLANMRGLAVQCGVTVQEYAVPK